MKLAFMTCWRGSPHWRVLGAIIYPSWNLDVLRSTLHSFPVEGMSSSHYRTTYEGISSVELNYIKSNEKIF